MRYLEAKISSARRAGMSDEIPDAFQQARHYIGRLSHHVRAPQQVIEDATWLTSLFETYQVERINPMQNIERPEPDGHTHAKGILRRMLPAGDGVGREWEEWLLDMNQKYNLDLRIVAQYEKAAFKPKVHAEVQVLEHFYQQRLRFAYDDAYIGCSKPACFCCRLYFRHHPMRCVEPDTHHNIWLNWGPPALNGGAGDEWYTEQDGEDDPRRGLGSAAAEGGAPEAARRLADGNHAVLHHRVCAARLARGHRGGFRSFEHR